MSNTNNNNNANANSNIDHDQITAYRHFTRDEWAALRFETPLPLTEQELSALHGFNEPITLKEVEDIYLPLSRLLNLYVAAAHNLYQASNNFLGRKNRKTPYIIGVAGSVAVGKSTFARVLRLLLARWPHHPRVALLPTDGFLYPNSYLQRHNLLDKKGFPQSFQRKKLLRFLTDIKSGKRNVSAPVYSHLHYDIISKAKVVIDQPNILIVEGLNVLQPGKLPKTGHYIPYVSDLFDFSIFIDAEEEVIRTWYIERFLKLRKTAFTDPKSYFHQYASLNDDEATIMATDIWNNINRKNLRKNILPTRLRASLILKKSSDHSVKSVDLRHL